MSSESFSAENRNALLPVPVRRCCSFCKNRGHNITRCNDVRLYNFERLCIENYMNSSSNNIFKDWLLEYAVIHHNLVKAYAVRWCVCSIRSYMSLCIDQIIIRIEALCYNLRNQQQNEIGIANSSELIPLSQSLPTPEEQHTSETQIETIGERISPLVLGLMRQRTLSSQDLVAISLFLEMMEAMRDEYIQPKKFNIETKINNTKNYDECECNICYDSYEKDKFIKLNCGHEFCNVCIKKTFENVRSDYPHCAFCRVEIKTLEVCSESIRDELNKFLC